MDQERIDLPAAVTSAEGLERLTRPMLELIQTTTGLESTYLTRIDFSAGQQHVLFSRNSRKMCIPEGLTVAWGDTLCKRAMEEGRAYADDVDTCWGDSQAARELGIRTYVSQPVHTADGALFGTLCGASAERKPLAETTLDVLGRFAQVIAQQVDRERALEASHQANRELLAHSQTDPLTGVANRRGLDNALHRLLASGERESAGLQVAMIDLDGFKAINDRHGHEAGDRFLVHIARRLRAALRPADVLARTGGDEFVVVSPGTPAFDLRSRLESATQGRFAHGAVEFLYAGASVGVVTAPPGSHDISGLLREADAAMYRVKQQRKAQRG